MSRGSYCFSKGGSLGLHHAWQSEQQPTGGALVPFTASGWSLGQWAGHGQGPAPVLERPWRPPAMSRAGWRLELLQGLRRGVGPGNVPRPTVVAESAW